MSTKETNRYSPPTEECLELFKKVARREIDRRFKMPEKDRDETVEMLWVFDKYDDPFAQAVYLHARCHLGEDAAKLKVKEWERK